MIIWIINLSGCGMQRTHASACKERMRLKIHELAYLLLSLAKCMAMLPYCRVRACKRHPAPKEWMHKNECLRTDASACKDRLLNAALLMTTILYTDKGGLILIKDELGDCHTLQRTNAASGIHRTDA
jgi:hypothetical protein